MLWCRGVPRFPRNRKRLPSFCYARILPPLRAVFDENVTIPMMVALLTNMLMAPTKQHKRHGRMGARRQTIFRTLTEPCTFNVVQFERLLLINMGAVRTDALLAMWDAFLYNTPLQSSARTVYRRNSAGQRRSAAFVHCAA